MSPLSVGVAIACHNSKEVLAECLEALGSNDDVHLETVVVDDGSTDGTSEMLSGRYPDVVVLTGDGHLWWTGGTNLAVKACLAAGCGHVLILNPDVVAGKGVVRGLLQTALDHPGTIVAPVVLNADRRDEVWWAGSVWGPVRRWLPVIWSSRYCFKAGTKAALLPTTPYPTSEAHGRAVLVPAAVFRAVGLYDDRVFPHYGADTDFSFRARERGFSIVVDPSVRVYLHVSRTGMKRPDATAQRIRGYFDYLFRRRNGSALRVWWRLTARHLPPWSAVPTFLFILALNTFRYFQRAATGREQPCASPN